MLCAVKLLDAWYPGVVSGLEHVPLQTAGADCICSVVADGQGDVYSKHVDCGPTAAASTAVPPLAF